MKIELDEDEINCMLCALGVGIHECQVDIDFAEKLIRRLENEKKSYFNYGLNGQVGDGFLQ